MQDDVPLSLQPEPHGRAVIVRLIGELDACSGAELGSRIEHLLFDCGLQMANGGFAGQSQIRNPKSAIERVVLDLSGARLRDWEAVRLLLCAHQRLGLLGCELILCEVPAVARGLLALLGAAAHLVMVDGGTVQALLEASLTET